MTIYMEYHQNSLRYIKQLKLPAIGLISVILNGCATLPSEPETDKTVREKSDSIARNVMLSESQGRVLLVRGVHYKAAQKNMPLVVDDRIVTIENARAAIDYVSVDNKNNSSQINCTVRIPGDSQFTVKNDIDCISGMIIANNTGDIEVEEEIFQPRTSKPEKQTRIAQHTADKPKKTGKPVKKAKRIADTEINTKKQSVPAKIISETPDTARIAHLESAEKPESAKPAVSAKTDQTMGAIMDRGPGVPIVQKVVSADKTSIGVANQKIDSYVMPAYIRFSTVDTTEKADTEKTNTGKSDAGKSDAGKSETSHKKPLLQSPDNVLAGTSFVVNWQGPDQPYDYITIVTASAEPGAYADYVYTREGGRVVLNAPQQSGRYEIRYVDGSTQKTLSRRFVTIN